MLAVDVGRRELAATMDDGRLQRFGPEELDATHLAHAYAITVHRSQGATVGRAHVYEDGGGRELAYVKMSRARERSTVYAVADSVEQAAEDWDGSGARPGVSAGPSTGARRRRASGPRPSRTALPCRSASVTPGWWPSGRRWPR